jgi:hypothetical protein
MVLFTQPELWALAAAGRWPLRPADVSHITGRPHHHQLAARPEVA